MDTTAFENYLRTARTAMKQSEELAALWAAAKEAAALLGTSVPTLEELEEEK